MTERDPRPEDLEGGEAEEESGAACPAGQEAEESEGNDLEARLVRLQADFENYRKRITRERARWHSDAQGDLVKALLPVIDNLELALGGEGDAGSIRQGLELIHRQLLDVLSRYDVERIQAEGQPFDPTYHEAVMQEETEQHRDGDVVRELRTGYLMGDRLLRPSSVTVAVGPSHTQHEEEDEG